MPANVVTHPRWRCILYTRQSNAFCSALGQTWRQAGDAVVQMHGVVVLGKTQEWTGSRLRLPAEMALRT